MATSREKRVKLNLIVGVAGCLALISLAALIPHGPRGAPPSLPRVLGMTAVTSLAVLWWAVFAVRLSRVMDEFMRNGELVAWYWGGLMGLIASMPVYVFIGMGGLRFVLPDSPTGPPLARAFASGYMLPITMQVMGALVVALWRRYARR